MPLPLSAERFSALVGMIYDCAVDPESWPDMLAELRRALGCVNATLGVYALPSGDILLHVTEGIPQRYLEGIPDYAADIADAWGGHETVARLPMDRPTVLTRLRPAAALKGNRYFLEWAKPQGIHDAISVPIVRDAHAIGAIGVGIHESAGPVTQEQEELLCLLMPHLQRAMGISRMLDIRSVEASTLEATLDAADAGIVLVDAALRIVHANRAAAAMLAAQDPIAGERGVLTLRSGAGRDALAAAVAQAGADEASIGRRGFGIPAPFRNGEPAVLHVLPMAQGSVRPGLMPSAAAAVFVAAAPAPAPEAALAALFDLTPAEAKVFSLIASGKTLEAAAQTLAIGQTTAKTHLLHIFGKTGTRRQAELIKLAASLSMPV